MKKTRPGRRTTVVLAAAGLAVAGAVGVGVGAANADGPSTPAASMPAPSGAPSGAPAAPKAGTAPKHVPHIGGEVLTVSGSTVTVKDQDGFTRTITLGSDVRVTKDGSTSSVSAIVKGEHIDATGTVDSNGTTLDATAVTIGLPKGPAGGPGAGGPASGPGAGGPGGHGPAAGGATGPKAGTAPSGTPSGAPSGAPSASLSTS